MTPDQYSDAIAALGLSQRAAGRFLKVGERTSRRWAAGDSPIPESAAILLRLMVKHGIMPDDPSIAEPADESFTDGSN
jgi:DNA-binding transcriptional regulator YiaG